MGVTQACCVSDYRNTNIEALKSVDERKIGVTHPTYLAAHKEPATESFDPISVGSLGQNNQHDSDCEPFQPPDYLLPHLSEEWKTYFASVSPSNCQNVYDRDGQIIYQGQLDARKNHRNGKGILAYPGGEILIAEWDNDWPMSTGVLAKSSYLIVKWNELPRPREVLSSEGPEHFSPMYLLGILLETDVFKSPVSVIKQEEFYYGTVGPGLVYEGRGILTCLEGEKPHQQEVKKEGAFKNGLLHGLGKITYSHGTEYVGQFYSGLPHGNGRQVWLDERQYQGEWFMGNLQGVGEFYWPDGRRYHGSYLNNLKHGYGEYFFGDGSSYRGFWYNGLQHGEGKIVDLSGKFRSNGEWEKGTFIGACNTCAKDQTDRNHTAILEQEPVPILRRDSELMPRSGLVGEEQNSSKEMPSNMGRQAHTLSYPSLCDDYLDMSIDVIPSVVRNEAILPKSIFGIDIN
jgi:hypothetical protein